MEEVGRDRKGSQSRKMLKEGSQATADDVRKRTEAESGARRNEGFYVTGQETRKRKAIAEAGEGAVESREEGVKLKGAQVGDGEFPQHT